MNDSLSLEDLQQNIIQQINNNTRAILKEISGLRQSVTSTVDDRLEQYSSNFTKRFEHFHLAIASFDRSLAQVAQGWPDEKYRGKLSELSSVVPGTILGHSTTFGKSLCPTYISAFFLSLRILDDTSEDESDVELVNIQISKSYAETNAIPIGKDAILPVSLPRPVRRSPPRNRILSSSPQHFEPAAQEKDKDEDAPITSNRQVDGTNCPSPIPPTPVLPPVADRPDHELTSTSLPGRPETPPAAEQDEDTPMTNNAQEDSEIQPPSTMRASSPSPSLATVSSLPRSLLEPQPQPIESSHSGEVDLESHPNTDESQEDHRITQPPQDTPEAFTLAIQDTIPPPRDRMITPPPRSEPYQFETPSTERIAVDPSIADFFKGDRAMWPSSPITPSRPIEIQRSPDQAMIISPILRRLQHPVSSPIRDVNIDDFMAWDGLQDDHSIPPSSESEFSLSINSTRDRISSSPSPSLAQHPEPPQEGMADMDEDPAASDGCRENPQIPLSLETTRSSPSVSQSQNSAVQDQVTSPPLMQCQVSPAGDMDEDVAITGNSAEHGKEILPPPAMRSSPSLPSSSPPPQQSESFHVREVDEGPPIVENAPQDMGILPAPTMQSLSVIDQTQSPPAHDSVIALPQLHHSEDPLAKGISIDDPPPSGSHEDDEEIVASPNTREFSPLVDQAPPPPLQDPLPKHPLFQSHDFEFTPGGDVDEEASIADYLRERKEPDSSPAMGRFAPLPSVDEIRVNPPIQPRESDSTNTGITKKCSPDPNFNFQEDYGILSLTMGSVSGPPPDDAKVEELCVESEQDTKGADSAIEQLNGQDPGQTHELNARPCLTINVSQLKSWGPKHKDEEPPSPLTDLGDSDVEEIEAPTSLGKRPLPESASAQTKRPKKRPRSELDDIRIWPRKPPPEKDCLKFFRQVILCNTCECNIHYGCGGIANDKDPRIKPQVEYKCPPCVAGIAPDNVRGSGRRTHKSKGIRTVKCCRPDCVGQADEFFVERVIGHSQPPLFNELYLVKWVGYGVHRSTWQTPESLYNDQDLIANFRKAARKEGLNLSQPWLLLREASKTGLFEFKEL